MPILTIRLDMDLDGDPLTHLGMPLTLRQSFDEFQAFIYNEPADLDNQTFSALPVQNITTIQSLLYRSLSKATGLRLEGGEAGSVAIRFTQNGLLLMFNCSVTATNITVNNDGTSDTSDARLLGFGGGQ